jgi:hypothetical protein
MKFNGLKVSQMGPIRKVKGPKIGPARKFRGGNLTQLAQ